MSLNGSGGEQNVWNLLLKDPNRFSGASEAKFLNKPIKQELFLSWGNPPITLFPSCARLNETQTFYGKQSDGSLRPPYGDATRLSPEEEKKANYFSRKNTPRQKMHPKETRSIDGRGRGGDLKGMPATHITLTGRTFQPPPSRTFPCFHILPSKSNATPGFFTCLLTRGFYSVLYCQYKMARVESIVQMGGTEIK